MKPTAYFITTARGSIHDEEALEAALRDKKIAGAGLDVWGKEPPAATHPLMKFDTVIVTRAYGGRDGGGARQDGPDRRRADTRRARRQGGAPASSIRRSGRITPSASRRRSALCREISLRRRSPNLARFRRGSASERAFPDDARISPTSPHPDCYAGRPSPRSGERTSHPVYSRMCMPWPQRSIR